MPAPWEIQPSEPPRWYARFEAYRRLGPTRSIERVFEAEVDAGAVNGRRPGQAWYKAAREWQWAERAEAWDAAERERLAAAEHARRFDRREARRPTCAVGPQRGPARRQSGGQLEAVAGRQKGVGGSSRRPF